MRLIRLPGVFRPRSDTWMLARALRAELAGDRRTVLDVCTGSGAIALTAAASGADATAVDVSRRSVATVRLNAALRRLRVRAHRGDLFGPVQGRRFDVIATNPPYVPATSDDLPTRGPERAWDAGLDGRALLDRVCAEGPAHLAPGGVMLVVQSSICGTEATVGQLAEAGLRAQVAVRARGPLGPLMLKRVEQLERRGAIAPRQRDEEVVVIRAERPRA
jgi:release factor glutamine methyltransferase